MRVHCVRGILCRLYGSGTLFAGANIAGKKLLVKILISSCVEIVDHAISEAFETRNAYAERPCSHHLWLHNKSNKLYSNTSYNCVYRSDSREFTMSSPDKGERCAVFKEHALAV